MFYKFLVSILGLIYVLFSSATAFAISANDISIDIIKKYNNEINNQKVINEYILDINLPNGWYTYYKNGGDAAKGPELNITNLPKNITATNIEFTVPEKEIDLGFVSYIYKNNAKLYFKLINNNSTENLKDISLNAQLNFLVCKDICVPISKNLNINLNFKALEETNDNFQLLKENFLSTKNTKESNFFVKENAFYLPLEKTSKALFIPNIEGLINDSAKQEIVELNNKFYLKVLEDDFTKPSAKTNALSGILINENTSTIIKYNKINAPITNINIVNILSIALLALLGGIILNFMPCVLPIITLKIYSIIKHNSFIKRAKGALFYFAGIFSSMMIIVAILLTLKNLNYSIAWGFQLQNNYFILFMITLLTLVSLNLLGLFNIGNSIANKATKLNMQYSNDFFTGVLTTLVATPCTAPFMATSLGFALTSSSNLSVLIIFTFLALGIAMPIILVSIIPGIKNIIPKPGPWTEKFKQFLAFPILATVVWLLWVSNIGFNNISFYALLALSAGFIYWLTLFKTKAKYIPIIAFLILCGTFIKQPNKDIEYIEFSKKEIKNLNNNNYDVFVDFTAKWCITCQLNKKSLHSAEVQKFLKDNNIKFMVADWTLSDEEIGQELSALNRVGVPVYALYKANGEIVLLPELLTNKTIIKSINESINK